MQERLLFCQQNRAVPTAADNQKYKKPKGPQISLRPFWVNFNYSI